MPNYCDNSFIITGVQESFMNVIKDNKDKLFDLIVPIPKDLEQYDPKDKTMEQISQDKLKFLDKYGYDNSYDFRVDKWGCKWNPDISHFNYDNGVLTIFFSTPWSPPSEYLLKEFAFYIYDNKYDLHPLEIKNYYFEPGMAFSGIDTVEYDGQSFFFDSSSFETPLIDCYSSLPFKQQVMNQGYPIELYEYFFDEDYHHEVCESELFGEEN